MEKDIKPFLTRKHLEFQEATGFAIQIRSISNAVGNVSIRGFTKEGIFNFLHTTLGTKTAKTETFAIPDVPIMLTIDESGTTFMGGSCYITATLLLNGTPVYNLAAGHVVKNNGLCWPVANNVNSEFLTGAITVSNSANPAAGAEINLPVTANEQWRILALRVQLVCAAAAASRRVHILIGVAATTVMNMFGSTDQIISETKNYYCYPGGDLVAPTAGSDIYIPMPPNLILPGGAVISTLTDNLNAGDDFGIMTALIEKIIPRA